MSNVNLRDPLTNKNISPATRGLQEEILAALGGPSYDKYETHKIVIGAGGIAVGPNVGCKDVLLSTDATDLQITIVDDPAEVKDGDTDGFLMPATITAGPLKLNVQNTARLRLYATAAKIVYLLVRI